MSLLQLKPCTVWIDNIAFLELKYEAVRKLPKETGGIFAGYIVSNDEYVITRVIGPGINAIHELERFIPDQAYHENELEKHFYGTKTTEYYLGDWHTHPDSIPYLSKMDLKTLKMISNHKVSQLPKPLMGILGIKKGELTFKIWQLYRSEKLIYNLFRRTRECELKFY